MGTHHQSLERDKLPIGTVEPDLGAPAAAYESYRAAVEALAKVRTGATISKTYDLPASLFQRVQTDTGTVSRDVETRLGRQNWVPSPLPSSVRSRQQRRTPDPDHRETEHQIPGCHPGNIN